MLIPLLLLACGGEPQAENTEAASAQAVDLDDPATCAPCHDAVVAEWNESMHARSHHDRDPIYGGMRALRMEKQGDEIAAQCAKCHTPRAPDDPKSAAAQAGVSCATCHAAIAVDTSGEAHGADAITWAEGDLLRGPHDIAEAEGSPHAVGDALPHLVDGQTMCLTCHEVLTNPQGVPACTTGPESDQVVGGQSCTDCHMPRVEGPSGSASERTDHASHAFPGPHRAWYQDDKSFLESAADLELAIAGDTLTATLRNTSGHSFPTGFPGRMAVLLITGRDDGGKTVWRNIEGDPMEDDPQAVLNKVYVDPEGNPIMPAFATELKRDNRLKPGETRTLEWQVPAEVVQVKAWIAFRLLPPAAAEAIGITGKGEAAPRMILSRTTQR